MECIRKKNTRSHGNTLARLPHFISIQDAADVHLPYPEEVRKQNIMSVLHKPNAPDTWPRILGLEGSNQAKLMLNFRRSTTLAQVK